MPEHESSAVSFKETLNLPHTDFPIRAQHHNDDSLMLERWTKEDIYTKTFDLHKGETSFILHDGPPYANGHLHLGHAYNNILKDIVAKSQRMMGKHVPVTPGWDCHGLPIEAHVAKQNPELTGSHLKAACRAYASQWVDVQKEERKQFGVFMDFEHPYCTMDFDYEANILRAFGSFVGAGYIERKHKTVPWCASCKTVLATAEIEYQERKDPSLYVLFTLTDDTVRNLFPDLVKQRISAVAWTTTPWTLPLNRALLVKPSASYTMVSLDDRYIIVSSQRVDDLCSLLGKKKEIVLEFNADKFSMFPAQAHHPFIDTLVVPFIPDESVSLSDGTAFVHCAPGAGPDDYETGKKNKLEIFSPISPEGIYTSGVLPTELVGISIEQGQSWVINKLNECNTLLHKTSIRHSYPHCWRCHKGLIFRATKQWFCDLSRNDLKEKTLKAITSIKTIPENSIERLKATIEGRLEWCLSRQRVWGIPIPALICNSCDHAYINQDLIGAVADGVAKEGIEFWDNLSVERLRTSDFTCPPGIEFWEPLVGETKLVNGTRTCSHCAGTVFSKETDILDVWFDSGVSHFTVLQQRPELQFPADMYLEGKDQHRGWFQSSLLTSMVLNGKPCMKMLLTHGFTVDAHGRKMSKSLGNVVHPREIMDIMGIDGLRLWVSSIDCASDATVSATLLKNVQEVFRKIRNTCRFLISNLYDFDFQTQSLALTELRLIDQYALQELFQYNHAIIAAYNTFDFTAAFHLLADYCASKLSSFYLDIIKDRLYVSAPSSKDRRSAQTVCWYILDTLIRLIAPILSVTAEQLHDQLRNEDHESIHLQRFASLNSVWESLVHQITIEKPGVDGVLAEGGNVIAMGTIDMIAFTTAHETRWLTIKNIRSALLKAIEQQREQGVIKHSLEAHLIIYIDDAASYAPVLHAFFAELQSRGETPELFFKELVIVSTCDIVMYQNNLTISCLDGLYVSVQRAQGKKCPRCWQWHTDHMKHDLCTRCYGIVHDMRDINV